MRTGARVEGALLHSYTLHSALSIVREYRPMQSRLCCNLTYVSRGEGPLPAPPASPFSPRQHRPEVEGTSSQGQGQGVWSPLPKALYLPAAAAAAAVPDGPHQVVLAALGGQGPPAAPGSRSLHGCCVGRGSQGAVHA